MLHNMIATIPGEDVYNEAESRGRNYGGDKEMTGACSVITLGPAGIFAGAMRETVVARIYRGRSAGASRVYATIWIRSGERYISGTGWAGGGGYHKASAALDEAIRACGITLSESIDGRGDDGMRDACRAIALAARPDAIDSFIVTHGSF